MKGLTLKNLEKATNLIMAKGYAKPQAEEIATTCFAMVSNFGGNVEDYIGKLGEMTQTDKEAETEF